MMVDPHSIPVLEALAGDADPKVRVFALDSICGLSHQCPEAEDACLRIIKGSIGDKCALDDKEPRVTVGEIAAKDLSLIENSIAARKYAERGGGEENVAGKKEAVGVKKVPDQE
jgi:hypothetical protein